MGDNSTMSQSTSFMYESFSDVPTSIDWRKKGAVTPIKSQGNCGITTEEGYPYQPVQETCDTEKQINRVDVIINGYQMVPTNDEQALLKVVANQLVSVAIEGYGQDFRYYSSGVYTGDCGNALSHALTIVGYGTSDEGLDYWLVKNSWEETWGENGYMRIQRNVNTQGRLCGIAMKASYISSIIS
ncbi:hypothetical protein ES319_D05G368700v1 [Gossypium barbadense]|uniref:Peptidase C1A papain C-terminal domain-containing protein n=2 Tax=Gossypium TaxID=3633 RepID=A0A0D2UZ20_GOSRA|nr:hypothetical protein ES319_D05G368700v1 [Gossypium barbadense]KJB61525.1 hypothetical protein B456_009G364100 [Gossypium raimondii]